MENTIHSHKQRHLSSKYHMKQSGKSIVLKPEVLTLLTVKELRQYCREENIKKYSKLKKNELVNHIIDEIKRTNFIKLFNFEDLDKQEIPQKSRTILELKQYCQEKKIKT